jgi:ribonuclease BN (tRNA processing enzyme)
MKLTVVGCSGSVPGPDGPASAYLVEHDGVRLLLDLGSGALGPLYRHVDPVDIDVVLLSHLHADHCLDLCAYAVARRFGPAGPKPPVPVVAPAGAAQRIAAASGPESRLDDVFAFADLVAGQWEIGPFEVRTVRVNHPVETYAIRVSAGGRSVTYSADTGRSKALVELARGSDLLLCEATFPDGADTPQDLHLTGREAGEHAERAGVERLLLTHIPPWGDRIATLGEACSAFGGLTEVAVAGAKYQL